MLMRAAPNTRSGVTGSGVNSGRSSLSVDSASAAPASRWTVYYTSPRLIQLMIGRPSLITCRTRRAAGEDPSRNRKTAQESRQ